MLTAERTITARIWELYRSILLQPVIPPSLTQTRVNSFKNDAIQYGTHAMHLASQFHERYDAVTVICAWQNPHGWQGTHLYGVILRDRMTGWTGLCCLCQSTAYFFPSSPRGLSFEFCYCSSVN